MKVFENKVLENGGSKLQWTKPEFKTVSSEDLKKLIFTNACSTLMDECAALFR